MPSLPSEHYLEPDSLTKLVGPMNIPWYRYFMASDPGKLIGQIRCPMLILNGEKDMQVYCDLNMDGLEKSCREAGKTNVEFRRFPGLNHLFSTAKRENRTNTAASTKRSLRKRST